MKKPDYIQTNKQTTSMYLTHNIFCSFVLLSVVVEVYTKQKEKKWKIIQLLQV